MDASGPSVNAAASSDFSNASYESASFSIRLDATNGIDTATFSPASALTAFSIWVNGTEQTGRIGSVDLEPAGAPTGIRLNLSAGTAFTAADNIEVRYDDAGGLQTSSFSPIADFTQQVSFDGMAAPTGSSIPANYNNPDAYTLKLNLKSDYAIGSGETLVISYNLSLIHI